MNHSNPKVTILMPVFNGEKYIKEAMQSILDQTFEDFEFLIINDGSTDQSLRIIKEFNDQRIRVLENENNIGLIATLNKGIENCRGEYIARMDCDDISMPKRLEIQVEYMDKHPDIGIAGSFAKIKSKGLEYIGRYFCESEEIRANLLFNTAFAHPSVIIRKEVLLKNNLKFDEKFKHAEDYDLWERASDLVKFSNIPEVLLIYRKHKDNVCNVYSDIQSDNARKIRLRLLKKMGIVPTDDELMIHESIKKSSNLDFDDFIKRKEVWLQKLIDRNKVVKYYEEKAFHHIILHQWLITGYANCSQGIKAWKISWNSPLVKGYRLNNSIFFAKFFLKCISN
jgi:glycosyltransferase involved in cell wall biosynthesis